MSPRQEAAAILVLGLLTVAASLAGAAREAREPVVVQVGDPTQLEHDKRCTLCLACSEAGQ